MSASTARRVGSSPRRWIGMIGNSWSMAQMSGSDWNMEKLQKYVSDSARSSPSSSSGTSRISRTIFSSFWQIAQNTSSATTRSVSDRLPRLNSCSASSLYSSASWYDSSTFLRETSLWVSNRFLTTREVSRAILSGALPTSNSPTTRMSTTSIELWATTARPDSVTMVGCATPAASQISCSENTMSFAYSWVV